MRAGLAAGLAAMVAAGWLYIHAAARPAATLATRPARPPVPQLRPKPAAPMLSNLGTAVFELSLSTERGAATLPRFQIAPGIARVELRLALDEGETYRTYRASVQTGAGRFVVRARGLSPRRRAGATEIVLAIPAADLRAGSYQIAVQGEGGRGAPEDVGFQEFFVSR
ncbi:MAG TPA: hypothetical protein VIH93_05455 [Thermoanaerobaculia bacterium]